MHLSEEYFKVINTVINGSYVVVEPIKIGSPKIEATLLEPNRGTKSAITTVFIYSMVKVSPRIIVFPWHANQNSR